MKLAISNIAWEPGEETGIVELFRLHGVGGLEIAPTKIWPEPLKVLPADVSGYRRLWADRGVEIVAMQALLFGKPELSIFGSPQVKQDTADYLLRIMDLGAGLGVKALVFGSPKNRQRGNLSPQEAREESRIFFKTLGIEAAARGVTLCLEPNPPQYGCDFVCSVEEGSELVAAVGEPGFQLHLDVSSMTLNQEPYRDAITRGVPYAAHFHVSEPFLACVGTTGVPHNEVAAALKASGYSGWISIEMKSGCSGDNIQAVERAIGIAKEHYQ